MAEIFRWKILANLDKSGALNSLKSLFQGLDKNVTDNVESKVNNAMSPVSKRPIEEDVPKGEGRTGGVLDGIKDIGKRVGEGLKSFGGLMKMVGKITLAAGAALGLFRAIQPALQMADQLVTLLSQLFRPINDALMMLIVPVFSMLRPIVQTINTLMMPFRRMAMEGTAASSALMGRGMQMIMDGDEGGGALIAEGLKGALSGASLLFSGFTQTLLSPLADLLGLGDRFDSLMEAWQASALRGISRSIVLNNTINDLLRGTDNVSEAASTALGMIGEQMYILEKSVDGFSMDNIDETLQGISALSNFVSGSVDADFEKMAAAARVLGVPVEELVGNFFYASKSADFLNNNLRDVISNFDAAQKAMAMQGSFDSLTRDMDSNKPGFFSKLWGGISGGVSGRLSGETDLISGMVQGWRGTMDEWHSDNQQLVNQFKNDWQDVPESLQGGLQHMLGDMDRYLGGSLIPDSMNRGLQHMLNDTEKMIGGEGNIVRAYSGGLQRMQTTTNNFATAIQRVANVADDALKKVEMYINKYNSAMSRVRSLEADARDTRRALR